MATKTEIRRQELKSRLVDIAETHVIENGVTALRAREIANEAGCALGAIYNVFSDLRALILEVNGRTFKRLGAHVLSSIAHMENADPRERLVTLSMAYLQFASQHTNAWEALFDVEMRAGGDAPEWYLDELTVLFGHIANQVSEIEPSLDQSQLSLITRTLFSAVHGIVSLGLENRISGVPLAHMEEMIRLLIRNIDFRIENTDG
jgi:AcrR family transcriptional regulator